MSLIELKNIKKFYGKNDPMVQALKDINITINKSEMVAIMGPSGSGKSTLLNILGFLDKETSGEYFFDGISTKKLRDTLLSRYRNQKIGFVVQNFALIDDYTVFKNLSIPLEYSNVPRKSRKERINNMLKKISLLDKKDKLPKELSGGQNQRIAIARAVINNPDIILADEPTGALDRETGLEIMKLFKELNDEGKTIVIITHDNRIAKLCKRIIYIEDGIYKDIIYEE